MELVTSWSGKMSTTIATCPLVAKVWLHPKISSTGKASTDRLNSRN
jgi:hypothetical protein